MNPILIAILSVTIIGMICAVILVAASKFMAVKEDERFPKIRECLPGANCGACGFAGCDSYAHALIEEEDVKTNLCIPGGDSVSQKLSAFLGVAFEDVEKQIAIIHCFGDCVATHKKSEYHGIESCSAAKLLFGGDGTCTFGCIGLGDCMAQCPNDAIYLENGIAHIQTRLCIGCGKCAAACPNHCIGIIPDIKSVVVTCNNHEPGAVTRRECTHGCIGCRKCERECPNGAVTIQDNLAVIDYKKCIECEHCALVCPRGCIMISDANGIHHERTA